MGKITSTINFISKSHTLKHSFVEIIMNVLLFMVQWILSDAIQPCVQCKFFKKDFLSDPKFGKCTLFSKPIENYFLVTGIETPKKIDYDYCTVARTFDSMCGEEGKYYQNC